MTYDFVISLKRPNYKGVNAVSVILVIFFLLSFSKYLIDTSPLGSRWWLIAIPIGIVAAMVYGFTYRNRPDFMVYFRTELALAAIGFLLMDEIPHHLLIGFAYVGMSRVERWVKKPHEIYFSKEHVLRRGLFSKTYQWIDIENVVLKDNFFTLDLRNNTLIQKELDQPTDAQTEIDFNAFCKAQLHFNTEKGEV